MQIREFFGFYEWVQLYWKWGVLMLVLAGSMVSLICDRTWYQRGL